MNKAAKNAANTSPMGGTGKTSLEVAKANMGQNRSSAEVDDIWSRLTAGEFDGQTAGHSPEVLAAGKSRIVKIPRDVEGEVADVFESRDGGPWTVVPPISEGI